MVRIVKGAAIPGFGTSNLLDAGLEGINKALNVDEYVRKQPERGCDVSD